RVGSPPASTKRRTEAANVTGPKSWRGNSACSGIAPTRPRPRRQITPPSSSQHITGGPRKRLSPNHFNDNRRLRKMDIYAIVTEKIVSLLEQGIVPWRRPWTSAGLPRNLVSKKPYRGINHFLL